MNAKELAKKIMGIARNPDTISANQVAMGESLLEAALEGTHCKVRCGCFAYEQAKAAAYEEGFQQAKQGFDEKLMMKQIRREAYEEGCKDQAYRNKGEVQAAYADCADICATRQSQCNEAGCDCQVANHCEQQIRLRAKELMK